MSADDSTFEQARTLVYEDRSRLRRLQAIGWFRTIANAAMLAAFELPMIAFWLFVAFAPEFGDATTFAQALCARETRFTLFAGLALLGAMNVLLVPRWTVPVDDEVSRVADLLLLRNLEAAASSCAWGPSKRWK